MATNDRYRGKSREEYDQAVRQRYAQSTGQGLVLPSTQERKTTGGGFYTAPVVGEKTKQLERNIMFAQVPLKVQEARIKETSGKTDALLKQLKEKEKQVANLEQYASGGNVAYSLYRKAYEEYNDLYSQYEEAYKGLENAAAMYRPAADKYNAAVQEYEDYSTAENQKWTDWRSTIRPADQVQAEISALDSRITELEQQKKDVEGQAAASSGQASYNDHEKWLHQTSILNSQAKAIGTQIGRLQEEKALLSEELRWSEFFGWEKYRSEEDFEEKRVYVTTANGKEPHFSGFMYDETGFDDINYDVINKNENAMGLKGANDVILGSSFAGTDKRERFQMTDEEIGIFNYLYAKDTERGDQNHTTAYSYIDWLTKDLNLRQRKTEEKYWSDYAKEQPGRASIFSVLTSPLKGLSYVGQATDYLLDGEIDQNASYNRFSYAPTAIREEVASNMGAVGSFAYNTGLGLADFVYTAVLTGGLINSGGSAAISSAATMTILGTSAAADTVIDAKDRGLDDSQAFALGTIAGVTEAVMENIGLDALVNSVWTKNAVSYILKNAMVEGLEEIGTETINIIADSIIAQDKSEFVASVTAYMEDGKTEAEAIALAVAQTAGRVALAGLGGFLSGSMLGTAYAPAARQQAKIYDQAGRVVRSMGDEEILHLVNFGLQLDPKSEGYRLAEKVQKRMQDGKHVDDYDVGALLQLTAQAQPAAQTTEPEYVGGIMLPKYGENLLTAEEAEANRLRQRAMAQAKTELDRTAIEFNVEQETVERVRRISQLLGGRAVAFYAPEDMAENGFYDHETGTVYVSVYSQNPVAQIVAHEVTHSLEQTEAYGAMSRMIFDKLQREGTDLTARRKELTELYARHGKTLNETGANREIVAQYMEKHLLTDEQSIREFVQQERGTASAVLRWINNVLAKLGVKRSQERVWLTQIRDLYQNALQQSYGHWDTESALESLQSDYNAGLISEEEFDAAMETIMEEESLQGKEQFSISPDYAQEIDQWNEDGCPDGEIFVLGVTGEVMQGLGAMEQDIFLRSEKINLIMEQHPEMTLTEIKRIPEILDDPILVLKSRNAGREGQQNTRLVLFGTVRDANGRPVMAVLDLRPVENGLAITDMQKVDSAYIKDNNPVWFVQNSDVLHADKNRTIPLLRSIGFQMPIELQQNGSIGSISYKGRSVNMKGVPFRNVVKERQYSYAGENARTADVESLQRALAMELDGTDMETIREETGWFKGMDDRWKFENDDSQMKYHRGGDASFSRNHPDYARYQQLQQQFMDGTIQPEDADELRRLNEVWGREYARLSARVGRGSAVLEDLLDHEALFEAYPQLRRTRVIFADMDPGEKGSYSRGSNTITLRSDLRNAPEETLLHEIQHAIQKEEGFARGANRDYWEERLLTEDPIRSRGQEEAKAALEEFEADPANEEALDLISRMEQLTELEDAEAYDGLWAEAERRGLDDRINRYYELYDAYHASLRRPGNSVPSELYQNTAGEIEARDTARRWRMTAAERRANAPDYGNADTVFAEDGENSRHAIGWTVDNRPFVEITQDILAGVPQSQWTDTVKENLRKKFPDGITVGSNEIVIDGQSRREMTFSKYMQWLYNNDPKLLADKLRATNNADEILHATTGWINEGINHPRKDRISDFARGTVLLRVGKNDYVAEVVVGLRKNGKMVMYDVLNLDPTSFKEKETDAAISTNPSPGAARSTASVSDDSIFDTDQNVNREYSYGDTRTDRKQILQEMQSALDNGGAIQLRRYVDELEDRESARTGRPAASEAERILRAAHRLGQSVEEYLRQNWELYETENGWNEDARKALDLEQGSGRQYSYSEDVIDLLPIKARDYLQRAERDLVRGLGDMLYVPNSARRDYLKSIAREISEEVLQTGTVSQETADRMFETAYESGIVVDTDFYDAYKPVKDYLRTQAITLSKEDQSNIADWNIFRRGASGSLRIVNEGGLPVDVAFMELQEMAPELFSRDLTHPADQLQRMLEVSRSIRHVEKTLGEYYGSHAAEYKAEAKTEFLAALNESAAQLRTVRRYSEERQAAAEAREVEKEKAPLTMEQLNELHKQAKTARREMEKVTAKNLLTERDSQIVGRLLRGEIDLADLEPSDNTKGITAVYEAKQKYEEIARQIRQWNNQRKQTLREEADRYLGTAIDWKDKKGWQYSRETMERNIRDIVTDPIEAEWIINKYFKPVHTSEAEATRLKNTFRQEVKNLNLSRKVAKGDKISEAAAVQLLGEAEDNIRMLEQSRGRVKDRDGKTLAEWRSVVQNLWAENPHLDESRIRDAVETFRAIYDDLFTQMNEARLRNGYEPISYRKGYFPHFQSGNDNLLSAFGKALGIETEVTALPTTINGLTHTFKPGIRWFGNALERQGVNTTYDAVQGFDQYIEGAASVICQTDNIQRLRALASQIRYRGSDDGIRDQIDAVRENPYLTEKEKETLIEKIYSEARYNLKDFVVELEEYTNLLANKKSRADREWERALGRNMYTVMKKLESRVAANMVAVNVGSWLTNYIPLAQGYAVLGSRNMLTGMWQTLQAMKSDDGMVDRSVFLTNRRGSDPLVKDWQQAASGYASMPMTWIDQFTAGSLVRARYQQNLKSGMSEEAAISEADSFVASVMADRSKGSMPTAFERANPVAKLFTQFQLEVNNQLSFVFKDMPREARKKGAASLALMLLRFALGSWLYNELYEKLFGRRPAPDPIGIINDAVGDATGYELPNLIDLGIGAVTGDLPSFRTEKKGLTEAGTNLAGNILEQTPFVGGLLDGGRVPISSAIPNAGNLWSAFSNEEWSVKKRLHTAAKEIGKPLTYVALPFGGGQLKKIFQGIKAAAKGGVYTVDAEGNDLLQYPVNGGEVVQAALMGTTSLPSGREWIERGFGSMSAAQTAAYQGMVEAGVEREAAFDLLLDLRQAEKTEEKSRNAVMREVLQKSEISGEGKAIVYYGLMASEREQAMLDALGDTGGAGEVINTIISMKNVPTNDQRQVIYDSAMTADEKRTVYQYMFGTKQEDGTYLLPKEEAILNFEAAGMDFDQFLETQIQYSQIGSKDLPTKDKATEFARWVNVQDLTDEQRSVIREEFVYFNQIPVETKMYDDFMVAGLQETDAYDLSQTIGELEPADGKTSVSYLQKWRAVVDRKFSPEEMMNAIREVSTEQQYRKFEVANDLNVDPESYVNVQEKLPKFDANGNGKYSQAEVAAALESFMGGGLILPTAESKQSVLLTTEQAAVLWQLITGAKTSKNNPFSTVVGAKVIAAMNGDEAEVPTLVLPK